MHTSKILFGLASLAFAGAAFVINNQPVEPVYTPREQVKKNNSSNWTGALEYYNKIKANQVTGKIEYKDIAKAREDVQKLAMQKASAVGLNWVEMGPDNIGGRTRAILIDRNNSAKMFAGGVSGGLFVSENFGGTWKKVDDLMENINVGSICQAINGDIYVGTGSSFDGSSGIGDSGFLGRGIFKSTDGGKTFTKLANASPPDGNNSSNAEWTEVNALAADPFNANRIYAAIDNGLRVTDDAGQSWFNPVFNNCTNPQNPTQPINSTGMDLKIAKDGTVYAVLGGQLWRSPSGNICTFEKKTGTQLPAAQRLAIDIAASDNNYVYAIAVNSGKLGAVYQSKDKGDTWTKILTPIAGYFDPFGDNGQGFYDLCIAVAPNNPNKIFMGGVELWKWDGNLTRIAAEFAPPTSGIYVHSDKHVFVFDPKNPSRMYIGTDGGITVSNDQGVTFYPSNKGYNVTQFYSMAFDNDGKVMGGTQDNGTLEIDGENPNLAMSADQVLGGDGFDCDYSNISGAMFATIYNGDVNRADANGSFAPICSSNVSFCGTGSFYTVIRLWETLNQPDSQHKITFKADTTKQGVGSGNGTKKTFTGTLTPLQAGGIIKKGSVKFQAGTTFLYDNDGDGVINAAAGTGTIDYNSGDFSVTFTSTPGVNLAIFAYFVAEYPKGTTLLLNSNTANIQVPHTLTDTLKANDSIVVMDPVQSFLAFGGSNKIYVTRGALDFSKTPQWWDVSAGFSGLVKSMEFSKDGKHLFVGTYGSGLYRLSGFNKLYHKDSVAQYITVTKILTTTQVVTGIAVDPNNPENVVATLGNYGNNIYVMRSTSAASTTGSSSFTSIQGNLPKMPVYDAVINKINPKVCVIGTEYGAYATNDVFANPVVWSDENSTFSHVPVHAVRQQTLDWNYASNNEVIYLGTHGRGIWKSGTLVSTPEIEHVDNSKASFISELSVYPNPLSEAGYISFKLKEASSVNINIYNMQGALVKAFSQEKFNAGTNRFQINTNHLPAGTYFTSVETGANRLVGKFVVVK